MAGVIPPNLEDSGIDTVVSSTKKEIEKEAFNRHARN